MVSLRRNGANVAMGDTHVSSSSAGALTVSVVHATLKLNAGDQIAIVLTNGQVFDSTSYSTQFTGSLLEEELVIS